MSNVPSVGNALTVIDVEEIGRAIKARRENFSDEPLELSIALVLVNISERFTPVHCINGEWEGMKQDIPRGEPKSIPKCPNGHVLLEGDSRITLGWVAVE